jgi:hypothetical protein
MCLMIFRAIDEDQTADANKRGRARTATADARSRSPAYNRSLFRLPLPPGNEGPRRKRLIKADIRSVFNSNISLDRNQMLFVKVQ